QRHSARRARRSFGVPWLVSAQDSPDGVMTAGDPAWRVAGHATGGEESVSQVESDGLHRGVLPIPDRPFEGTLPYDAKDPDASFPAIEPLQPPAGAPNVLVILLDDVGFAASSAFGGPCATWTAERLAGNGL